MYCCVPPTKIEVLAGVRAIDTSVGPLELSTRRFAVELCVRLPLVPVIVTVYPPVVAVALAVRFRVVDPDPVTEVGLNVPVTPAGKPLTLKAMEPLNPPRLVAKVVKLVLLPWTTFCELGDVESEKSTVALTTSDTVVE